MNHPHLLKLAMKGAPDMANSLMKDGWEFVVGDSKMVASGMSDCANKKIIIHPRIAKRTYGRDYRAVLPHEMGHARDCMMWWPSKWLIPILSATVKKTSSNQYDHKECREIVASRVAMILCRNDKLYINWLGPSFRFHRKHGNMVYSIKQIRHPAVTELAYMLLEKSKGGTYFHFVVQQGEMTILPIGMTEDKFGGGPNIR